MSKYLVTMRPLEPYSFGTDQGYSYPGEIGIGKNSYFAKSGTVPAQTTILGMIRYLVLMKKGYLKSNFDYSQEERERNTSAIGSNSFSFKLKDTIQDFGSIKEISPLFLLKDGEVYIKNPFNNRADTEGYIPCELENTAVDTSLGAVCFPQEGEYNSKKGLGSGYICLNDKKIVSEDDLFMITIQSGNRKNNKNEDETDGYFKREYVSLKEGYLFAVYVDADELPNREIGYMGSKKSAFEITCELVEESLEKQVMDAFADVNAKSVYYALSDLYTDSAVRYSKFCMVKNKYQRNLETDYSAGRMKKSECRVNMVESGSVFYEDVSELFSNQNAKNIGYNRIVKLGGI